MGNFDLFFATLFLIFFFSLILHEFAHALVAYLFGDDTPKREGRLTLNPLVHIDPLFTLALPILSYYTLGILFGGAKPVRVNPEKMSPSTFGDLVTTLAGPSVHFFLATLLALALHFLPYDSFLAGVLAYSIPFQLLLFFLNLLPIPPLDGGMALRHLFPSSLKKFWQDWLYPFGWILLLGLVLWLSFSPHLQQKLVSFLEESSYYLVEWMGTEQIYEQARGFYELRRNFRF